MPGKSEVSRLHQAFGHLSGLLGRDGGVTQPDFGLLDHLARLADAGLGSGHALFGLAQPGLGLKVGGLGLFHFLGRDHLLLEQDIHALVRGLGLGKGGLGSGQPVAGLFGHGTGGRLGLYGALQPGLGGLAVQDHQRIACADLVAGPDQHLEHPARYLGLDTGVGLGLDRAHGLVQPGQGNPLGRGRFQGLVGRSGHTLLRRVGPAGRQDERGQHDKKRRKVFSYHGLSIAQDGSNPLRGLFPNRAPLRIIDVRNCTQREYAVFIVITNFLPTRTSWTTQ